MDCALVIASILNVDLDHGANVKAVSNVAIRLLRE